MDSMLLRGLPVIAFTALCALGCSTTPCDEALDKVASCGIEQAELNDNGQECAEYAACQADCFNVASCNDIKGAFQLQENELTSCTQACGE